MLFIGKDNIPVMVSVQDIMLLLQKTLHRENINLLKDLWMPKSPGQDIVFTCTFHKNGNENRPSAGIMTRADRDTGKVYFNCFTCHEKGTLETLVSRCFGYYGENFGAQWILKHFGTIEVENREGLIYIPTREKPKPKKIEYVSEEELDKLRYTCSYHYQRYLNDWAIETYDLGYCKDSNLGECITFPVKDITGGCLFVAKRAIHKKIYHYPQGVIKPVFGIYEAKKLFPNSKEVYICESMLNAITLTQKMRVPTIALLGTGIESQYEEIKKLGYRCFYIALDPDQAGMRGRDKLIEALKYTGFIKTVDLPEGKDINDLGTYDDETFSKIIDMYTHFFVKRA